MQRHPPRWEVIAKHVTPPTPIQTVAGRRGYEHFLSLAF
jgi:hypothetical protein